ncbi:MAG: TIGR00730 family Rossman fold protein [Candidatus Omnitrophica bacterium]|nr:TIGR00730 family Rossman fold protein [Candidatus Omnitrophota bacterium]
MPRAPGPAAASPAPRSRYTTGSPAADAAVANLLGGFGDGLDRTLLTELMTSVYRLGEDRATTGDLKILNSALKELRYAFAIFRPYRQVRKVAVFGSARTTARHPSYPMAQRFGKIMAEAGWMVITGAASGIMKAGHEGAGRDASFGLNIRLPFEQGANPVIARDRKLVTCKYFFTRKLLFVKESHATVLFPGGFGTLDEGFEVLTLVQTGKTDPRPIVFVETPSGDFWKPLLEFLDHRMVETGMISPSDRAIYQVARSADEAAAMIRQFYVVYHSARYVGSTLVMRLQRTLPRPVIEQLNRIFKDLLTPNSSMTMSKPLPEEAEEEELRHLPRLIVPFNRRECGRLIEMIRYINASPQ